MTVLETYEVPRESWDGTDTLAARYWVVPGKLLVGGLVRGTLDGFHLAQDYGVTHVLNVATEGTDIGKWPTGVTVIHRSFDDNGHGIPPYILADAIHFAWSAVDGVLHIHCRKGGSRSPAIAYAVLRSRGQSPDQARAMVSAGKGDFQGGWHPETQGPGRYVPSIEEYLAR